MKTIRNTPPFTKLVASGRFGGDPSKSIGHPHSSDSLRKSIRSQTFSVSDNTSVIGLTTGVVTASTGTITVQDNSGFGDVDFSTGFVYLTIGDITIEISQAPSIQALAAWPTPTIGTTATAIRNIIRNITGFATTSAALGVVSVNGPGGVGSGLIPFSVSHRGTLVNLVLAPLTGFLTAGTPTIGAPTSIF